MRTPAGKECKYFYGDYYRGKQQEECRLLASNSPSLTWRRDLCETCPVPGILMANACPNMELKPNLIRSFPFIKQKVKIKSYCSQTDRSDFDTHVGCGECHRLPDAFKNFNDKNSTV